MPDSEYLGWEMTAVATRILGAKGAYRCPGDNGFIYFVYSEIQFASEPDDHSILAAEEAHIVECATHGTAQSTAVCEHRLANPRQKWFSNPPCEDDPWPDAWCMLCEEVFLEQGEWNDTNSDRTAIKILCHKCYEAARAQAVD